MDTGGELTQKAWVWFHITVISCLRQGRRPPGDVLPPQSNDTLVIRPLEGRGCLVQGVTSVLEFSLVGHEHLAKCA